MTDHAISRREFVGDVAAAGLGFHFIPRHVLGGRGYVAPNDKLNIACIGVGGMGRNDVRGVSRETVYALCDVDANNAAEAAASYPDAGRFTDFREMLDREAANIDAVTVSTPDHTHAVAAMMALKLGKHVYCPPAERYPRVLSVYEEWINACKGGPPAGSSFDGHAGPLTEMVLLGNLAVRTGRVLELDPNNGRVTNTTVPEEYLKPVYREGWSL